MHYISPIRLFHEELKFDSGEITARELSLIKRKLLAEAELSDKKTVIRDGVEFSKEDIVNLFDQLDKNMRIDFHLRIFNNKPLLNFLETGEFDFAGEPVNTAEIKADKDFCDFIQPWFIPVWIDGLLFELREKQFSNLAVLMLAGIDVIDEFLLPELLQPVEAKLWDLEYEAKLKAEFIQRAHVDEDELDLFINDFLISFLNELPYTFGNFRNSYMLAMINITVYLFNTGHKGLAAAYGNVAVKLNCDDFFKNQMKERLILYKSRGQRRSRSFSFNYIWLIAIAFSTFARLSNCNNSNSLNTYSSAQYNFSQPSNLNTQNNQYGQSNFFTTRPRQSFYLFQPDNNYISTDSQLIQSVTHDRGNAIFLTRLVKELRQTSDSLKLKGYLATEPGIDNMNITGLQAAIDSGWHRDYELNSLSTQNARGIVYNNTATPMFLVYKYGKELLVRKILPDNGVDLEFQTGSTIVIPFFGVGWDKEKKVYTTLTGKPKLLIKGWFIGKTDKTGGPGDNVTLLNVQNESIYADTIRFNYSPTFGYSATITGESLKRAATPASL